MQIKKYIGKGNYCYDMIDVQGNSQAPASIVRSLNLVMYFGCQLDEPYRFPGDHQPDATML